MPHAKVTSTAWLVSDPPDHREQVLIVEIDIDCPECGQTKIRIPGHHLKAVRDICQSFVDQHPTLTGGRMVLVDATEVRGTLPKNPEHN